MQLHWWLGTWVQLFALSKDIPGVMESSVFPSTVLRLVIWPPAPFLLCFNAAPPPAQQRTGTVKCCLSHVVFLAINSQFRSPPSPSLLQMLCQQAQSAFRLQETINKRRLHLRIVIYLFPSSPSSAFTSVSIFCIWFGLPVVTIPYSL